MRRMSFGLGALVFFAEICCSGAAFGESAPLVTGEAVEASIKGGRLAKALTLVEELRKRIDRDFRAGLDKFIPAEVGGYKAVSLADRAKVPDAALARRRFVKEGQPAISLSLAFGSGIGEFVASLCDDKNALLNHNLVKTEIFKHPAVFQRVPGVNSSSFTVCLESGGLQLSSDSASKEQFETFSAQLGEPFYSGLLSHVKAQG